MRIGIVCYPTYGGSGVVATELGRWLAIRGHKVDFFAYARPFRLASVCDENLRYHRVDLLDYPVFPSPSYTLSLAVKIAEICREARLDVVHVHYAVPHAISAYLAQQMCAPDRFATVTTLHGTDVTLVGQNPALRRAVRFAIEQSDAVTAVSQWLRDQTVLQMEIERPIEVIPNWVDAHVYGQRSDTCPMRRFVGEGERAILHISNFRPVKRVCDVVEAFARIRRRVRSRLLLVGDGPERQRAEDVARELGILEWVSFFSQQSSTECFYAIADLFLLASEREAFGLAALEAMAAEVPVIGYASGGLRELVRDGETGFLVPFGDTEALAERAVELLGDEQRRRAMGKRARQVVLENYLPEHVVPRYEALYEKVMAKV